MNLRHLVASAVCLLASALTFAHDNVPAAAQTQPLVIVGARVHTVSAGVIEQGRVRFEHGKIVAVGGSEVATDGAQVIDANGLQLYPGLIAAEGTLGLSEVSAIRATEDIAEVGANNADLRTEVAFNPDSEVIPVTRANGVLLALSTPGSRQGNVIAGRSALLRLDGWTIDDMLVKSAVALHVSWPGGPIPTWLPEPMKKSALEAQEKGRTALREAFEAARRYAAEQAAGIKPAANRHLAAMVDAIQGRQPVYFNADDVQSIQAALDFAAEFKLKAVIVGGADAGLLTDALNAQNVPVILSGLHRLPSQRDDAVASLYSLPAQLAAAGVRFAISNGGDSFSSSNLRNLPYQAGSAMAFGLTPQQALRAITLTPAEIMGVADRYGSIDQGKSATLFLAEGDALEPATRVTRAWIDGREIDLSSRHTRLYDKYRQKYPQTRD